MVSDKKKKRDYRRVIEELREIISECIDEGDILGLAISLVTGRKVIWAEGFGYVDRSCETEITPDTLFSIQSTTKTYTATALLLAVHKGLVNLDDPLLEYYPEFSVNNRFEEDLEKITFKYLLTHRAGLCHEAPIGNNNDDGSCTFEEHVKSINDTWLKYPIGNRYSYSNLGYDLIAYALQRIHRKTFEKVMKEELFECLKMNNSVIGTRNAVKMSSLAKGYEGTAEDARNIPMLGAAGMYSTVRDMAKYLCFQLDKGLVAGNRLISEDLIKRMTAVHFAEEKQTSGVGYGVLVDNHAFTGVKWFSYAGGGYGYQCDQSWIPEYGLGVVILTNQSWHDELHVRIEMKALELMIREKIGQSKLNKSVDDINLPEIVVDPSSLKKLVGGYSFQGRSYDVVIEEGKLVIKTGSGKFVLKIHSETSFTTSRGHYITFFLNDNKKPVLMKMITPRGFLIEFDCVNPLMEEFGPNCSEWKEHVGLYKRKSHEKSPYAIVWIKNGYLYIRQIMADCILDEYNPELFFTRDGEAIIFEKNQLIIGNEVYVKEENIVEKIKKLSRVDPSNEILASELLENLEKLLALGGRMDEAKEIQEIKKKIHYKREGKN